MARYIVEAPVRLYPLQSGDYPQDMIFTIPDVLSMTLYPIVNFKLFDEDDVEVLFKTTESSEPGITILLQDVTVLIREAADTINLEGTYYWELEIANSTSAITVGYGDIIVRGMKIINE